MRPNGRVERLHPATAMLLRGLGSWLSGEGSRARLTVLLYHRVHPHADPLQPEDPTDAEFDEQLGAVATAFNVLPLSEAVDRLTCGRLPRRALCITFDDGYADNCTVALPILRRYGLFATFFIASGYLNGGRMWNDGVIESIRQAPSGDFDLRMLGLSSYRLDDAISRRAAIAAIIHAIKHLPPVEREARAREIADLARARLPDDLMMTRSQVAELHAAGMEIGGHTVSHPILTAVGDEIARREIAEGREALAGIVRAPVMHFAYPNGRPGADYSDSHVRIVRELGFSAAFSTASGSADRFADAYQLPRFSPWDRSLWRFIGRAIENYRRPASALA